MAEKGPKRKAKPQRDEKSVLGTLPATRPERIGRPRRGEAKRPPAAKPKPAAAKPAARRRTEHGPTAVRPASPPLRVTDAHGPPPQPIGAPTGTELVTTTIRAAGELAQIGFTLGGQMVKRTIDRIPRP